MKNNQNILKLLLTALFLGLLTSTAFAEKELASGSWTKKSHSIDGSWKIVDYGSVKKLKFTGFKTKSAPDLKIIFSKHTVKAASNSNALEKGVVLAELKKASGYQEYELPADFDISNYKSLLIHCEKYSKLWGAGSL
ncbi:MAG: DM13 domain-containing protein [Akkermansiaceae bacterium]